MPRKNAASGATMPATALEPRMSVFVAGKPLTLNHAYPTGRNGRRYLSNEGRAWKLLIWGTIRQQAPVTFAREEYPLRVHCTYYGVRGDADNYLKMTLDALVYGIHADDRNFSPVTAQVVRGKEHPQGVLIEVWPNDTKEPDHDTNGINTAVLEVKAGRKAVA